MEAVDGTSSWQGGRGALPERVRRQPARTNWIRVSLSPNLPSKAPARANTHP